MNNRLGRAGPGTRKRESRRIGRPATTPDDHPELHSETAFSNDNAGRTLAQTAVGTSCHFCGLPLGVSPEQPEQSVPRLRGVTPCPGCSRPFPLAWVRAFSAPVLWYNAWTTSESLRVRAVVVGITDGGARRRWTEGILFGGGGVSPHNHDLGDDAGTDGTRVLAYPSPEIPKAAVGVASQFPPIRMTPTDP